jgi:hypothetical protein
MADDEKKTKNIFDAMKILRPPDAKDEDKPKSQVELDREAAKKRGKDRRK